jgi:hypothetical protein
MAINIKDEKTGANISVASVNGYSKDKVILAKRYLKEIGSNRRTFPIERMVEMYNEVKGTKEKAQGCKPCQATKYFNGLQNYAYFGELTLVNTNKCTKDELDLDLIDRAAMSGFTEVKDYQNEVEAIKEELEEQKKDDIKERMAKVRAAKKNKKESEDKND